MAGNRASALVIDGKVVVTWAVVMGEVSPWASVMRGLSTWVAEMGGRVNFRVAVMEVSV